LKILLASLNWGLGHATRTSALVGRFLSEGNEVVLAGDGESFLWLRQRFPQLRALPLPHLQMRYSSSNRQTGAILRALPALVLHAFHDHAALRYWLDCESFDWVISDNRFGFFSSRTHCIYLTHQVWIRLPKAWHWAEPLAHGLHRAVMRRYSEVWIPDNKVENESLAGMLSHRGAMPHWRYIGPLSRFSYVSAPCPSASLPNASFGVVAVLSGLEPQRSLLESQLAERFLGQQEQVLIVRGKVSEPSTIRQNQNITFVAQLDDSALAYYLTHAGHIIVRSGYSTIMDLSVLGLLRCPSCRVEMIPTPGQPEQEYLAAYSV